MMVFLARHVCRLDPWPDALLAAFGAMNPVIYGSMWGSEVRLTGNLKDWDVSKRLGEVRVPTLVLSGAHDEMTPGEAEALQAGIQGSERVLFADSAHLPMIEEPAAFLAAVADFLDRVEA